MGRKVNRTMLNLIKKAIKIAKKYGVDPQTIDFEALIDPAVSIGENEQILYNHILQLIKDEDKRAEFREKYLSFNAKRENEKLKEQMDEELEKYVKNMLKTVRAKEEHPYYTIVNDYISLLLNSDNVNLLIIKGEAGTGKTTLVLDALNKRDVDYEYLNGITAFELYDFAYEHNNTVIVLDDISLTTEMVRLLKALTDTRKERKVSWVSRAKKNSDVPQQYTFTGKIILITNDVSLDLNEHYSALATRGYILNIKLHKEDILSLIRGELGSDYETFMADITELSERVSQKYIIPLISLRTAIKYKSALAVSRKMAKMVLVNEIEERAKEMMLAIRHSYKEFNEMTGKSRRTWNRYRAMYRYLYGEFVGGDVYV